jgi:hypothetical protein
MQRIILAAALLSFAASPALASNICKAGPLTCATTMPIGGYCECTAHGQTEGGESVPKAPHRTIDATAGGCNVDPHAPGCH